MVDSKRLCNVMLSDISMGIRFPFALSCIGVVVCLCIDSGTTLLSSINRSLVYERSSVLCVHYFYFNAVSFGGVFSNYFVAILAALPFSANYCIEQQYGFTTYKVLRCGRVEYCFSKMAIATFMGGASVFIGSLCFVAILSSYLPVVTPQKLLESTWIPYYNALRRGNGITYFLIVLYLSFLSGSLWGSIALCISAYFPNLFVTLCSPLVIRFFIVQAGRLAKLPNAMRLDMLLNARGSIGSDCASLCITTFIVVVLIKICYRLFFVRIEKGGNHAE